MAHVYRTPTERVAEELGKLTFSEMMLVAEFVRDNILAEATIENDMTVLDVTDVARVLDNLAKDGNDEYKRRSGEAG